MISPARFGPESRLARDGRVTSKVRRAVAAGAFGLLAWVAIAPAAHALAPLPGRNMELKAQFNHFPPAMGASLGSGYASCWHYVHGDGREYAVLGYQRGTAIYNVTDPEATYLVDTIPGPPNLWREMKSYRNWIYVVTESRNSAYAATNGLQIIRMTDPEHPVLANTYKTNFLSSHTVQVDTSRALLVCNGTNTSAGQAAGMRFLSLANPEVPVEIGKWPNASPPVSGLQYVHDSVFRGNRLFASSLNQGQRIIDTTNPAAPVQIAAWSYPGVGLTHNAWPDSSGNYLYVTDEQNGQTLRVFDITNLGAPAIVSELTSNPQAIVHNAHVKGHELYLANYTEGIRVLDLTDPAHPAEFAWADTRLGASGGYAGVWGVDPYFPSGTVIASDMNTGLYVFRPVRDYGRVRVEVLDAATQQPLDSVLVSLPTQGDSANTFARGIAMFAPSPGSHSVQVTKFGYQTVTLPVTVAQGSLDTLRVALVKKSTADLMGTVRDAVTQNLLADAEVNLRWTPVHAHAAGGGDYHLHGVPDDLYRVDVRRPGYIPVSFERRIGPGFEGVQDFQLAPAATWEKFTTAVAGWVVSGGANTAALGRWERAEPRGTGVTTPEAPAPSDASIAFGWARDLETSGIKPSPGVLHGGHEAEGATPGQVQPEYDRSPAPDSMCFVTANGSVGQGIDVADVDSSTTLTSPAFNMTGMVDPAFGVWLWFYSQFRSPDDFLAIQISNDNGVNWVPVDTLRGIHNHWEEHAIRVADHVPASAQMKLRFTAVDGGEQSVVEAAIDDLSTYDAATLPVGVIAGSDPVRLSFRRVWPNPARDRTNFVIAMPSAGLADVDVIDIAGRHVRSLHRGRASAGTLTLQWDGADDTGHRAAAGLYFARARTGQGTTETRFVRM